MVLQNGKSNKDLGTNKLFTVKNVYGVFTEKVLSKCFLEKSIGKNMLFTVKNVYGVFTEKVLSKMLFIKCFWQNFFLKSLKTLLDFYQIKNSLISVNLIDENFSFFGSCVGSCVGSGLGVILGSSSSNKLPLSK